MKYLPYARKCKSARFAFRIHLGLDWIRRLYVGELEALPLTEPAISSVRGSIMAVKAFRFNKSNLKALVQDSKIGVVRDTEINGLKFKVGARRSVFLFEKRVSGKKSAPAVTITIGAFPAVGLDEARQEARRLANLCERGIDPREDWKSEPKRVITFHMAVEKFFSVKRELSKYTLAKYRNIVTNHIPKAWHGKDLTAITSEMIVGQFHAIRERSSDKCWEFLKVFLNIWNTCAPFFRDRKNQRLLKQSPIPEARNMLKNVPRQRPKRSVIPANLLGKFVVTVERLRTGEISMVSDKRRPPSPVEVRMCDIALLTLFTGFRFGEVRWLKWDWIDLDHGTIHLPGDARNDGDDWEGTKNRKDHYVPLSSYAWDLLKRIHDGGTASPYVFPAVTKPDQPVCRHQPAFKTIAKLIGIHYSPHASRRTFASAADEAGLGFLTVKRLLNHSFQGGVTGGYIVAGFNPDKERANFQKVCDYILDRRAEYLGETCKKDRGLDINKAMGKLKRYALELGLDPQQVLKGNGETPIVA